MKVLACGSRDWTDSMAIRFALETYGDADPLTNTLIHGNARGADLIAAGIAHELGWSYIKSYPANWNKYGKIAGFLRNQQMLDEGKPDVVLAFWDGQSRGTKMMIDLAKKAGTPVAVYYSDWACWYR